jgi:hypothetical protein
LFVGRPWQATEVLQPAGLLYRQLWAFQLWPPDSPAPADAFRTLAAEVGTYGWRIRAGKFCLNADSHGTLLHKSSSFPFFLSIVFLRLLPRPLFLVVLLSGTSRL